MAWEKARRHPGSASQRIASGGVDAGCIAELGAGNGKTGPVVNSIIDYHASGAVQVVVVVVDSTREKAFVKDPLSFHFADRAHPGGDPSRTSRL